MKAGDRVEYFFKRRREHGPGGPFVYFPATVRNVTAKRVVIVLDGTRHYRVVDQKYVRKSGDVR